MAMNQLTVDGSYGEGGGQILRYAALYSLITGKECYIVKIRANRPNPGLRPQHYTLLRMMKDMFGGFVEGLRIGSTVVRMRFKNIKAVHGTFNIGTAGSISLMIQSIVPPLLLADSTSEIVLSGGTDVKWSPPIDYMKYVYRSLINFFGGNIEVEVLRRGFYPRGGGKVKVVVEPSKLSPRDLILRSDLKKIYIVNTVCKLPKHVLDRQGGAAYRSISKLFPDIEIYKFDNYCSDSLDPGTSILIAGWDGKILGGGDSLGERGKPAEKVAEEAVNKFMDWVRSGAALDRNLSDMAIPLAVLSGGNIKLGIQEFTGHVDSALYVSKIFLEDLKYTVKKMNGYYLINLST